MNSATFKIEDMHCDGCARTIKALISAEPGVQAAEVSFKDGQARILYDPQRVAPLAQHRVVDQALLAAKIAAVKGYADVVTGRRLPIDSLALHE